MTYNINMASVSDIITYIGIPLTLLGILPIFYTMINSLLTHRNILRLLRSNTPVFATTTTSTSGSLISGIIEVTLPRFSIAPLDRSEPEYWTLNPQASGLPGGSWTLFNWNHIVTATKTYRLQYSDDLQIPQAEVDFQELMNFLMDRGSIPDAKGLGMLRVSGLWTPTGTPLLVSPDGSCSVLRIAGTGDSDGALSLALSWEKWWDQREEESLPVGWMRLEIPSFPESDDLTTDEKLRNSSHTLGSEKQMTSTVTKYTPKPDSLRFRLAPSSSGLTLQSPTWEHLHASLDPSATQPSLSHLTSISSCANAWFPSLALTYALSKSLPLHTCSFPVSTLALRSPSACIPAGVMVLLGLITEEAAPEWGETKYDPHEDAHKFHQRIMAQSRAQAAERMMAPEQARVAKMAREAEERAQMMEQAMSRAKRDKERIDRREREAVGSVKLSVPVVADKVLNFLSKEGRVHIEKGLQGAVETLLVGMVRNEGWAIEGTSRILDKWREWAERGGMTREDLDVIRSDIVGFSFAACAVGLIADVGGKEENGLVADMRACLGAWRRVRLG